MALQVRETHRIDQRSFNMGSSGNVFRKKEDQFSIKPYVFVKDGKLTSFDDALDSCADLEMQLGVCLYSYCKTMTLTIKSAPYSVNFIKAMMNYIDLARLAGYRLALVNNNYTAMCNGLNDRKLYEVLRIPGRLFTESGLNSLHPLWWFTYVYMVTPLCDEPIKVNRIRTAMHVRHMQSYYYYGDELRGNPLKVLKTYVTALISKELCLNILNTTPLQSSRLGNSERDRFLAYENAKNTYLGDLISYLNTILDAIRALYKVMFKNSTLGEFIDDMPNMSLTKTSDVLVASLGALGVKINSEPMYSSVTTNLNEDFLDEKRFRATWSVNSLYNTIYNKDALADAGFNEVITKVINMVYTDEVLRAAYVLDTLYLYAADFGHYNHPVFHVKKVKTDK